MSSNGITVGVRLEDGSIVDGKPIGLQLDKGTTYMTVELPDGSIKRIVPPEGWVYSDERGWYPKNIL